MANFCSPPRLDRLVSTVRDVLELELDRLLVPQAPEPLSVDVGLVHEDIAAAIFPRHEAYGRGVGNWRLCLYATLEFSRRRPLSSWHQTDSQKKKVFRCLGGAIRATARRAPHSNDPGARLDQSERHALQSNARERRGVGASPYIFSDSWVRKPAETIGSTTPSVAGARRTEALGDVEPVHRALDLGAREDGWWREGRWRRGSRGRHSRHDDFSDSLLHHGLCWGKRPQKVEKVPRHKARENVILTHLFPFNPSFLS